MTVGTRSASTTDGTSAAKRTPNRTRCTATIRRTGGTSARRRATSPFPAAEPAASPAQQPKQPRRRIMAQLIYNNQTGRYEGETLTVDADLFAEAVHDAERQGMSTDEAYVTVREESSWTLDMEGVAASPTAQGGR